MLKCSTLSCASRKFRSDVISMCVVPVQIRHPDSNKVHDTYACWETKVKAHL